MIDKLVSILTFASGLGCELIGGVFFAFSVFVMKALARLSPAHGIVAMQSINIAVINPLFSAVFFGTAVGSVFLATFSLFRWQRPGAVYLLIGGLLYLVGTILVTMLFNVRRNNALAAVDPTSSDGARLWTDYVVSWTAWNHVRTIAALAAAAFLTIALCRQLTFAPPR
jgi:uncharacterized membrane protein